ncbi:polyprenyl synthetase family protein [Terricaulis silvestris]|uniref:Octaprenyl diphosphate synthase n=1 Tax=Terricaulis silvestris TaxID=2686094 RepID=A0A6I6MNU4_9CAUL|nr:polyprenyl synthetase family protein [Terricaulis silvestris]QGZ95801.1 Octaprenyl-diphosphate synthase [Terricaulis silvestris]
MGTAAGQAEQAPGAPHAVDRLAALLAEDLAAVDALIHQHMTSPVGVIPNLATHLIDAGGKRIRPLITLAAARLLGGGGDGPRKLAAAVEFIHSATLLHDDVVDVSSMRRGKKSANVVWGNSASVLVGDFLFARSFNLMVETGDIQVLDILARAASVIAEGEVMQLAAANDAETSRERYMAIVAAKTAALFAAAARSGAVAAGRPGEEAAALDVYGRELGLAFQLVDDALDYGGLTATMGKNVGDDFREGKVTLPVVFARDAGDEAERVFWRRVMGGERTDDDFHRALSLMKRHNAIGLTLEAAREHAAQAKAALKSLPANAYREALADLPDFVVDRAY